MTRRHITRVTLDDGSVVAELWIATADVCPHCGAGTTWARGDYRVCTSCRRGWELERAPHSAIDNPALAQLVEQLAGA